MLGQSQKCALSDFFGQGRLPHYPQCGRMDQIDVKTHKLRERLLAPAADVCPNEHLVSVIYHSKIIHRWTEKRTVIHSLMYRSELFRGANCGIGCGATLGLSGMVCGETSASRV